MITSAQMRAARALLGIDQLVDALQEAGIDLIAEGAASGQGGRGVRLVAAATAPHGTWLRRA